ncbi:MAG: hypothetical protein Q7R66_13125 [Undibacterium sp.]|uniref:YIP1 family protein n=1 Tax=Undibacterium sp. TaxID=1914977 RepID=UPI00271ADFF4|nr:YIP1 family protein [Undibacterium sp.]MDO8653120.1 hypothetical protein [Undibacterium sp.]
MNLFNLTKMPFSFHGGWDTVVTVHPSVIKTFLLLVLPFSLIPPATLLYAGSDHASMFQISTVAVRWQQVALVFFIAELLTVPLMGWLIKTIAAEHKITVDFKETFLLAAIIAVPMWLSSLGLAVQDTWTMIAIGIAGLLAAASLLYHGAYVILKMDDPFEAQSLSYQAFAAGAVIWVMLCAYIVLPLMT